MSDIWAIAFMWVGIAWAVAYIVVELIRSEQSDE